MANENKETQGDTLAPRDIALKLRLQDTVTVSPIDLELKCTETLHAEHIQWLNFYEPPLRLALSNSGDTVMIRGQWPNRQLRPTIFGGPLDGQYIFSQAHFHWSSSNHELSKHTINGKSNILEMHALFYKSIYHDQAQAQEKEDGIVIVVYFFKIDQRSSFRWMTDQLLQVTTPRTTSFLPPAPLCALMVPFTGNYLAYWGSLACACHHVLWLVTRTPLRITEEEIKQFSDLQINPKEKICSRPKKSVNTVQNVYLINPSNNVIRDLFLDAIDPPCHISSTENKITIAIEHSKKARATLRAGLRNGSSLEVYSKSCKLKLRKPSTSVMKLKSKSVETSIVKKPVESKIRLCSKCKSPAVRLKSVHNLNYKLQKKRSMISKRNPFEFKQISDVKETKMPEKKGKVTEDKSSKENEEARKLLEKEREEIKMMKKELNEGLKRLAEKEATKETPNDKVDEVDKSLRRKSPIQKSVLTSKLKSFLIENNLNKEKINIATDRKSSPPIESESPRNAQCITTGDQNLVTEKEENKKKAEPPKSKLPIRTFSPWRPKEGLKSSLSPYFSGAKGSKGRSPPDSPSNTKISMQVPKYNKRIVNRTTFPQRKDCAGKGDKDSQNTKKGQQNPIGHMVAINYL